MLVWLSTVPKK